MSKLLEEALIEVRKLPPSEQDGAAGALIHYLASRHNSLLSDDQLAEVRRRRSDPDQVLVSNEQAREFIRRLVS
ncbi:hypothetical protein FNL55_17305 [Tardiphaga sp. vice352]|uniref:hypothetical protein n=1 Tax=unclassified Tardiphaga TaxID=2631404 RepID=UPI001165A158|nr:MULTISPECIES: hypothetical protein [unclassified Tardiphaga]QDM17509.1 hypothetical protein FNL53_17355 [Tardiphaga sp. vice278]QDM22478.1 hypothetical protein FIU28_15935 [Tardiphaga sp. vice154]QDM27766.1 hypothetical protein FNL56_17770 [Tardiphaga sp. vice304]QDM32918.1 hypothetical protein FNL55_17305 [Tardiphaga sp. vice352]